MLNNYELEIDIKLSKRIDENCDNVDTPIKYWFNMDNSAGSMLLEKMFNIKDV